MVSLLDRTFTEKDARFRVVQTFQDGRSALEWLSQNPADLVVLDVYMPLFTGVELLQALRTRAVPVDAIMVTAATDTATVDHLLKMGVVDYLVKPFTYERFQQALDTFCRHREAIAAHTSVSQEELDALLSVSHGSSPIPKGLQAATLVRIRERLGRAPQEGCTCEALAEQVGLSSVTVRRYLTYLVGRGEATSRINYDTGGRPSLLYCLSVPK